MKKLVKFVEFVYDNCAFIITGVIAIAVCIAVFMSFPFWKALEIVVESFVGIGVFWIAFMGIIFHEEVYEFIKKKLNENSIKG